MNSNFELNRQLANQRLEARYQDAAQHRLAKQHKSDEKRVLFRWFKPKTFVSTLIKLLPRRHKAMESRPAIQEN